MIQHVAHVVGGARVGERFVRIVQRSPHRSSQHKASGDTDRAEGAETVGSCTVIASRVRGVTRAEKLCASIGCRTSGIGSAR